MTAAEIIVIAALVWAAGYSAITFFPMACFALRTGIFKARGRVYLREMHPVRFWFGVCFFCILPVALLLSLVPFA